MNTPLTIADGQSGALSNVIINQTQYDFNVILINPEGKFFVFRHEAIKDLTIYDAINQYASDGYMVYDNSYDVLERPAVTPNSADPNQALNANKAYSFRGDARDILRIEITPQLNPNNASSVTDDKIKYMFTLNYEYVIYDIEDTMLEESNTKLRKLYFRDLYQQILSERNVEFSTANIAKNSKQNSSNAERAVKTGVAIQELIKKTLPTQEGFTTKFSDFDAGATDIFFTAPADYKAEDSLRYLLERHVSISSNNYDKCFLKIERYPKLWSLLSLKQMFDRAYIKDKNNDAGGPYYLERFLLGGSGDAETPSSLQVTVTRSPKISLYFGDNNTVENFTFLPPAGIHTQQNIVSKIIHTHRNSEKAFYVDSENNDFDNMLKTYHDCYVKNMKGANDKPISNIVSNKLRSSRQNVDNVFSTSDTSPEQRLGVGRSDTLKDAVFLNKTLSIRVTGATYRQAGYFISLDRNGSLTDCPFDDKLLGIYLIVEVRHTFMGNTYYNDLICVKTYNYKDDGDQTGNYL